MRYTLDMTSDELASWLSEQLNQRGWSARELARRAGVSHTAVVRAANGQSVPGWQICLKLAQALGVPDDIVLDLAGYRANPLAAEHGTRERVLQILDVLNEDDQNLLLTFAERLLESGRRGARGKAVEPETHSG